MTVGHGCPQVENRVARAPCFSHSAFTWRCGMLVRALIFAGLMPWTVGPILAQPAGTTESVNCELRIVWGGPEPRSFEGTISVEQGTLRVVRNLSLQPDSIGTLKASSLQSIEVIAHSPSVFGGVDLALQGSRSSQITLSFKDPFSGRQVQHDVRVGDVLAGTWVQEIDERGTRIAIERQMHDRFRVRSNHPHHVFDIGQRWNIDVSGYRTGLPAGEYTLQARFVRQAILIGIPVRQTVSIDSDGSFQAADLALSIPDEEGAYHLELSVRRRHFLNSLLNGTDSTRRVDIVAIDPARTPEVIGGWNSLMTIDPLSASTPGSLSWLSPLAGPSSFGGRTTLGMPEKWQQYNPLAGSTNQPIRHGNLSSRTVRSATPPLRRSEALECLTLSPDSWLAIPLAGLTPDVPHRARVQVPTDRPMQLAVCIRQSGAAGEFASINLDSGILITPRECTESGELTTHDVIFWPSSPKQYLLLVNHGQDSDASVAKLLVEEAQLIPANSTSTGNPLEPIRTTPQRQVGLYLDKPLLPDSFGASRQADPVTGRTLESWQTHYEATERLGQYMSWAGANTLVLKVFADGGAVFPCEHLTPTPRFDGGVFFSDGRSPEIKDSVELLLRDFDRDRRSLILALDIDSTLPSLSRWDDGQLIESILQRTFDGSHWTGLGKNDLSRRPRYNPLNSRVQSELIAAIREIVDRYGHHRAFAGIALQLDQDSQLVFAGDRWGYDAQSLASFQHASQVKLPPPDKLEEAFSGSLRLAYLHWRAQELTKLYGRLGQVLQGKQKNAKLYLNAARIWDRRPHPKDFFHADSIIRNPTEYLMAFGIDADQIQQLPGVVLMRGSLESPSESINPQDWVRQLARKSGLQQAVSASAETATVVLQQPRGQSLVAVNQLGEVALNPVSSWIYPQLSGPAEHARKRLVDQVFHSDPQLLVSGGWLPVVGQEESLQTVVKTLREFPPIAMDTVQLPQGESNLRIRTGVFQNRTYIQLVNNAPWTENLSLTANLSLRTDSGIRILGDRQLSLAPQVTPEHSGHVGSRNWQIQVPPYDIIGIEIDDAAARISGVRHWPNEDTLQEVTAELLRLETMIATAADPTQQKELAQLSGDFERWSTSGRPAGWNVSSLPNVQITRSTDLPHSGQSSLLLENRNQARVSAWIQSQPFAPPATGRLALHAWLRSPAEANPMLVRLSVIGRTRSDERFERSYEYGQLSESGESISNDWGRRPATLFVSDIPADEIRELYVAIDLVGPGKVWIDDVEVFEAYMHPDERRHVHGQMFVAKQKLAQSNPYPAEQLLDSRWGRYLSEVQPAHLSNDQRTANPESQPDARQATSNRSWNNPAPLLQQWRDSIRQRWRR